MVKWISRTPENRMVLKSIRLERDDKDIVLQVNGLVLTRFTASGDILMDAEAIMKAKVQN